MGLNMDVDHVAFAQRRKFDGRRHRDLTPAELAQIAGRAGRHKNDGSFGVTADLALFDEELVGQIENHEFEPIKSLMWRNPNLDFSTLPALIISLEQPAPRPGLARAPWPMTCRRLIFCRAIRPYATLRHPSRMSDYCGRSPKFRISAKPWPASIAGWLVRFSHFAT